MHSRYFPVHCTRSGFNLVANCVFKLVVFKCRAVTPICWPPCPGQRLVWRPTEWCHCPTWRCLLLTTTPLILRIPRNCKPPYVLPTPASPILSSKIPPVNDLTPTCKRKVESDPSAHPKRPTRHINIAGGWSSGTASIARRIRRLLTLPDGPANRRQ